LIQKPIKVVEAVEASGLNGGHERRTGGRETREVQKGKERWEAGTFSSRIRRLNTLVN
jgi:hypothetical protein